MDKPTPKERLDGIIANGHSIARDLIVLSSIAKQAHNHAYKLLPHFADLNDPNDLDAIDDMDDVDDILNQVSSVTDEIKDICIITDRLHQYLVELRRFLVMSGFTWLED